MSIFSFLFILFERISDKYAAYDSVRGVYESVRATYGFFCGVYGVVRGVFSFVHGVFGIFFLIPKKAKKDECNATLCTFRSKKRTIFCVIWFSYFLLFSYAFGIPKNSSFSESPLNSATIASEKCHYCKAKQAILTSKTGTIPVQKWHYSDVARGFSFPSALRSARCSRSICI